MGRNLDRPLHLQTYPMCRVRLLVYFVWINLFLFSEIKYKFMQTLMRTEHPKPSEKWKFEGRNKERLFDASFLFVKRMANGFKREICLCSLLATPRAVLKMVEIFRYKISHAFTYRSPHLGYVVPFFFFFLFSFLHFWFMFIVFNIWIGKVSYLACTVFDLYRAFNYL